jgi:peroxiredoxin
MTKTIRPHTALRWSRVVHVLIAVVALAADAYAEPAPGASVGQPAPAFTGVDSRGRAVSLADYRGSIVVLEWTNHDCPFVRRHYGSGNMQALQKEATRAGAVWLTVISSAPGEQGFVDGEEADNLTLSRGASPTAVLLDSSGTIGHAYNAKTTPQMFVIDADGRLAYMGAIDDQPRDLGADPATANNYVRAALTSLNAGQPVAMAVTRPYGCAVKYKVEQ